jgi:hypothetical protein
MLSQNHFAELNWHVLTFLHSKSAVECVVVELHSVVIFSGCFLRPVSSLNNPQKEGNEIL